MNTTAEDPMLYFDWGHQTGKTTVTYFKMPPRGDLNANVLWCIHTECDSYNIFACPTPLSPGGEFAARHLSFSVFLMPRMHVGGATSSVCGYFT